MNTEKLILIIDDDSRNIFALSLALKIKGFKCVSCLSAYEGIDLLQKENNIGVILMDMMMPEMDGYLAIKTIRSYPLLQNIPIISVTAQAMQGDREKCLNAGAQDYISKPIDIEKLIIAIKKVI